MILTNFSKVLKKTKTKKYITLLSLWLKKRISKPAKTKTDKIIQKECWYAKNNNGDFIIIPKSETGRNLTLSLYNYIQSVENVDLSRFLHENNSKKYNKCEDLKNEI